MSEKLLVAELRKEKGKNQAYRLRQSGFIPAVLYSHGKTEDLKISKAEFFKLFKGHISESVIFDINISDKKEDAEHMAFVKDYQKNPVTGEILHLDFFKVTKGEKIHTTVALNIIGNAVGVKHGGILEISEREIAIECLPKDLKEKIDVDITNLDVGDSIHAIDLNIGEGIKLMINEDAIIASVVTPKAVAEEAPEGEEELLEGEEVAEGAASSEETGSEE